MNIERYVTPYKLNEPALKPSGIPGTYNSLSVDCPLPFKHQGQTYMIRIGYNGERYQTALSRATNDSLIEWEDIAVVLAKGEKGAWDQVGRAGCSIISNESLFGDHEIEKIDGKYWMFYHAYPGEGYETGPAEVGVAWTEDENLLDWHCCDKPIFSWKDGEDWEKGGLYKCWVIRKGSDFYMFYNAKNVTEGHWHEQIGCAVSNDMFHWKRVKGNPIIRVDEGRWNSIFASDPVVFYDEQRCKWIMFFYGFDGRHAVDGIAESSDLIHWEKHSDPLLVYGDEGSIDEIHAHKPGILFHNNMLYHFYCACRHTITEEEKAKFGGEYRCISVARSAEWRS